ncbi:MAG: hypothetical protein J1G02_05940 [Clostridiales bacterium]|nr:hypothetical protein [Clostridiales bacterium]
MKRVLSLIMCLALALTCATLFFVACNDHEHDFDMNNWGKDASGHWHQCKGCDEKTDVATHTFVNGVCSACGYVGTTTEHKHSYATAWSKDDTYHWHAATCEHNTVVADKAKHSFNSAGRCTVCNYDKEGNSSDRIDRATWIAIFSYLAQGITNFTQTEVETLYGETSTRKLSVKQDAIHEQATGDREYDEYILFEDGKAVVYEMYNGAWIPFVQRDYIFNDFLVAFYPETFDLLDYLLNGYDNFVVDDNGSYVYELVGTEYKVSYEVVLEDEELVSVIYTLDALNFESTTVTTLSNIGSTEFDMAPYHVHQYNSEYVSNNRFHWHEATCHDGVVDVKLQHDFGDDGRCNDCGYVGTASSGAEVTEEQWKEAFVFNGINNWTYSYVDFGIDTVVKYTGNALESVDSNSALAMDENGTVWNYRKNNDAWYKSVSTNFADVIELRTQSARILSGFTTLAKVFNQFSYADGKYTATGVVMGNLGLTNATVEVIFDDGEIVSINVVVELESYTTTVRLYDIGVTTVYLDGAVEHEHNWQVRRDGSFAPDKDVHNLICWECNSTVLNQPHSFVNGECTVCGVSNHQHVFDNYKPIADGALHVSYCECGVEGEVENHTWDSNGECIYCHYVDDSQGGDPDPDDCEHDYQLEPERSDSDDHAYVCSKCGDVKWESHEFDDGDECVICGFAHYWEYNGSRDAYGHWMECTDCYSLQKQNHIFNAEGVCEVCGYEECKEHVVTDWHYDDEDVHYGYCDNCDEYLEEEHNADGDEGECTKCGYREHEHDWVWDEETRDEDDHWLICSICGQSDGWNSHVWEDIDGMTQCSVCGLVTGEHDHVVTEWSYNDECHWGECVLCDQYTDSEEHSGEVGTTCKCGYYIHTHTCSDWSTDEFTHWGNCDICDKWLDVNHTNDGTGKCTVCGEENIHVHSWVYSGDRDSEQHELICENDCGYNKWESHTDDGEGSCKVCGLVMGEHEHQVSEWRYDKNSHWGTCELCERRVEYEHDFEEDGAHCKDCEYFAHVHRSGDWSTDEFTHWGDCDICGEWVDIPHTDDGTGHCDVCGEEIHYHDVSDWATDEDDHWGRCDDCGEYILEGHVWGDDGHCEVCGYPED